MGNRLKIYRTIEGVYKEFRPIGYCHLRQHKGYIDAEIENKHHCIQKKCLFLEKCKSRNEEENIRREKLLQEFRKNVKELFDLKQLTSKECYRLLESKSDLYAQRFLNNLKKGIVYTGLLNYDSEDNWDNDYYDVRVERNKVTIGDILANENKKLEIKDESKLLSKCSGFIKDKVLNVIRKLATSVLGKEMTK